MKKIFLIAFIVLLSSQIVYADMNISGIKMQGLAYNFYAEKRVYCLGDSITVGLGDSPVYFSYRDHLQDLIGVGVYDFVGGYTDPDSDATYDVDHGGVSGTRTANVLGRIQSDLETYLPRPNSPETKIFIHIGTNDSAGSTPGYPPPPVAPEVAAANVVSIVQAIVAYDPNIHIYVALIIPHRGTGSVKNNQNFINFNNALRPLILAMRATNTKINLVDMYSAMNNDTFGLCGGLLSGCYASGDDSHPKDTGYQTMALQWDACIDNESAVNCNGN